MKHKQDKGVEQKMIQDVTTVLAVTGLAAIGGAAIYKVYKDVKRKEPGEVEQGEIKDFEHLPQEQLIVEKLMGGDLAMWFRENDIITEGGVNKLIAYPTKEVLNGLGYGANESIDVRKSLVQWFYDIEEEKVLKIRFLRFDEMDEKLVHMLEEAEGMICFN